MKTAISLADLITAGNYDWVNPDILREGVVSEEILMPSDGRRELRCCNRCDGLMEVTQLTRFRKFKLGTVGDLLAWGVDNLDEPIHHTRIVAMIPALCLSYGSYWLMIERQNDRRILNLHPTCQPRGCDHYITVVKAPNLAPVS